MGLSASQARLLSLTARLSDLELRAQQVSNSKIRLAMEGAEASEEYERALDKEELYVKTGFNADGTPAEQELNYFNLTGVNSPLSTQYGLCDLNGRILVTQEEANAFVAAAGSVEEFCRIMGAPYKVQYANGADEAAYVTGLEAFLKAEKDLNDYANNVGGANNGTKRVNGYTTDGQWAYTTKEIIPTNVTYTDPEVFGNIVAGNFNLTNYAYYGNGYPQSTVKNDGSSAVNTAFCFYQGNGDASSYLTSTLTQVTSSAKSSIVNVLQNKLGSNYGNISAKVDSALSTATGNLQSYYLNQLANKQNYDGADLNNVDTINLVQGTNQVWDDTHGAHEYYVDLSQVTKTFLAYFDAAYTNNTGFQVTGSSTVRPAVSTAQFANGAVVKPQNFNSVDNPDKIDYQDPNGEGLANVASKYQEYWQKYQEALANLKAFGEKKVVKSEHTDYYTNLYNKMTEGYFTSKNINDPEWIQNQMINNGLVLYKCTKDDGSGKMTWKSESWKNCKDIDEEADKSYIAKAEAKYESEMADINGKDKRFDMELKNIDTEHQAIQTEVDSVKKVIDKNIDRSFKMFQA